MWKLWKVSLQETTSNAMQIAVKIGNISNVLYFKKLILNWLYFYQKFEQVCFNILIWKYLQNGNLTFHT